MAALPACLEKTTPQNQVGTVRTYHNRYMGRKFTNTCEIVEYDPPNRVFYRSTPAAAVRAEGGTIWEAVDCGTRITMVFTPQLGDFWGLLPKSLVRRMHIGTLKKNLRILKQVLEKGD